QAGVRDLHVVRAGGGQIVEVGLREVAVADAVRRAARVAPLEDVGAAQDPDVPEVEAIGRTVGGANRAGERQREEDRELYDFHGTAYAMPDPDETNDTERNGRQST